MGLVYTVNVVILGHKVLQLILTNELIRKRNDGLRFKKIGFSGIFRFQRSRFCVWWVDGNQGVLLRTEVLGLGLG